MITRKKRAKMSSQNGAMPSGPDDLNNGVLKAVENNAILSPEKKMRKTSSYPFRKKKGGYSPTEDGQNKENCPSVCNKGRSSLGSTVG
ncbi:hypothetical protein OROMI_028350 [Orobanche minor]